MDNALQKMQEMVLGFDSRINRLRAEIEAAEIERKDVETAIRVLISVSGVKPAPISVVKPDESVAKPRMRPPAERRKLIMEELGDGESNGKPPVEVFRSLQAKGVTDIDIATLRTALWRMAKNTDISSGDGRYWKIKEKSEGDMLSDLVG